MNIHRRWFIRSTIAGGIGLALPQRPHANAGSRTTIEELDEAAARPILNVDAFKSPVIIESTELFQTDGMYFVRSTSKDGAVGIAVTNSRARYFYPIFYQRVAPYFIGKDARELESLIDGVYRYQSNYKLSGLALWCCVAWIEFSLLDMLGKMASKPVGELLGGVVRKEVPVYVASGNRHTTAEEEAVILKNLVEQYKVKAVKFKVGGRMSNDADSIPGRSEKLIPLARKTLGDDITIHADSNGSYNAPRAIEIGRLLEEIDAHFFEEPCPFDYLEETKRVADALDIMIAGGEQETSVRRFRWMIHNQAVQVVQPDLHYNGGFIRAKRVAHMAEAAGMPITVHMSGGGVGFVDMLQFCSCTPNIGRFQEYKGGLPRVGKWYDPPLEMKDGSITVPSGPGLGLREDLDWIGEGKKVTEG